MKALIVYQPGITGFTHEMAHQIAAGLNDKGYEVMLNHPGRFLSSDVSQYSLVIFCSPVYSGQPSRALSDYMSTVKTSPSCRIVLISTGGFKYYMELDAMERSLRGTKAYKKVKFITGDSGNDRSAYHLGLELSK
jgi:flavodoxin